MSYPEFLKLMFDSDKGARRGLSSLSNIDTKTVQGLIHYYRGSPCDLGIEPGNLIRVHVDAAVTAIVIKRCCAAGVRVWKVIILPKVSSPPGIMEEVATCVKFHRILNRRWWIPEG